MPFDLGVFSGHLLQRQAVQEITRYNQVTQGYGLHLSEQDAIQLLETRAESLEHTGIVEFGSGVIGRLIEKFRDSPFIRQDNYVETIRDLIEVFYYYKNETLDLVSDDDLIEFMKTSFNGKCNGSVELLRCRDLEALARKVRRRLKGH